MLYTRFQSLPAMRKSDIENRIAAVILSDRSTYAMAREYLTSEMFDVPFAKWLFEQFEAAWDLFKAGEVHNMHPTDTEIISGAQANGWTATLNSLLAMSVPAYYLNNDVFALFEWCIRAFCIERLKKIVDETNSPGLIATLTAKLYHEDTPLYMQLSDVVKYLTMMDMQTQAESILKIRAATEKKGEKMKAAIACQDIVDALDKYAQLQPHVLIKHANRLTAILDGLQETIAANDAIKSKAA